MHSSVHYMNRKPAALQEAPFFRSWGGSWDSDYGRFFMGWYSGALLAHGERLMAAAASIFKRDWPVGPFLTQQRLCFGCGSGFQPPPPPPCSATGWVTIWGPS